MIMFYNSQRNTTHLVTGVGDFVWDIDSDCHGAYGEGRAGGG